MISLTSLIACVAFIAMLPFFVKNGYMMLCMLLAGAPRMEDKVCPGAPMRLAFLIPAHNEASVVGSCVRSILSQEWSNGSLSVFVIADNCKDTTAAVAREAGAHVFERTTAEISGKAQAVRFGIESINQQSVEFDYLVIVDADNLLAPDWADVVSRRLKGHDGFQTYVETKNPRDSAVTFGNYLSFVFMNRVIQEGRSRVGLPALLAGTGMGFSRDFICREGFASNSLTEDRDLSAQALDRGYRFQWIGNAVLFDEKPVGAKASFNQYKRWSSGQLAGIAGDARRLMSLLGRGKLVRALDILYSMTGPILPFSYLASLLSSLVCFGLGDARPLLLFVAMSALSIFLLALMLTIFGRGVRDLMGLGSYIYVRLISWASLGAALIRKDQKWVKTVHDRGMSTSDMEQIRKGDF